MNTVRQFTNDHNGPLYSMPASEAMGFINSKYQDPHEDWPDIQLFLASFAESSDGGVFSRRGAGMSFEYYAHVYEPAIYKDAFMVIPLLMRPQSRGKIILNSRNPRDHPAIFANYFQHPRDLDVLVGKFVIQTVNQSTTSMTNIFTDRRIKIRFSICAYENHASTKRHTPTHTYCGMQAGAIFE